jgi:hypothetical protein
MADRWLASRNTAFSLVSAVGHYLSKTVEQVTLLFRGFESLAPRKDDHGVDLQFHC